MQAMQTSDVDVFDPEGSSPVNVVKIKTVGRAVQLLETLLYKMRGSGFDFR